MGDVLSVYGESGYVVCVYEFSESADECGCLMGSDAGSGGIYEVGYTDTVTAICADADYASAAGVCNYDEVGVAR